MKRKKFNSVKSKWRYTKRTTQISQIKDIYRRRTKAPWINPKTDQIITECLRTGRWAIIDNTQKGRGEVTYID